MMGFKDSVAYVQRQIDKILRPHREFAKAYVDNVVVHSSGLQTHITHLDRVFQVMDKHNVKLAPSKTFLG